MSTNGNDLQENVDNLTDDARSLIAATADATEEKVIEARNRLNAALEAAKDTFATVQRKAVQGAKAADQMVRDKPYHAIGLAFGVGALVGFLLSRRSR
jgi:ElaB/YqjD/DUF883 family membrane-anchored ribosome-binding protein